MSSRADAVAYIRGMFSDRHMARFNDLMPDHRVESETVALIGCGAIGSRTAVELAKMGLVQFCLFDFDRVDAVNVGVQMFTQLDVGLPKTEVVSRLIRDHGSSGVYIEPYRHRVTARSYIPPEVSIFIVAVDSMAARRSIWRAWRRHIQRYGSNRLFIDARMGFDSYEVYSLVNESDRERYVKAAVRNYTRSLKIDAPRGNCGMEAAPFTAGACSATIATIVANWMSRDKAPIHTWVQHNTRTMTIQRGYELNGVRRKDLTKRRRIRSTPDAEDGIAIAGHRQAEASS